MRTRDPPSVLWGGRGDVEHNNAVAVKRFLEAKIVQGKAGAALINAQRLLHVSISNRRKKLETDRPRRCCIFGNTPVALSDWEHLLE